MKRLYGKWMNRWENHLCFRATDRVVRPYEPGLEYVKDWPWVKEHPKNGHDPVGYLQKVSQLAMGDSVRFFSYEKPTDFGVTNGNILRFSSPVKSPHPANNVVHGQWFPAKKPSGKAVVVVPHWNASAGQHVALAKGLAMLGISAVRLSLPYHDFRMPAETRRADYAVSSNLGRTMAATRQAVVDIRATFDWLQQMGYESLGLVGTSLGSCYGCLASAHDERIKVNVFNHCSTYFADVVWTGLSTKHIVTSLEGNVSLDELRKVWQCISPVDYLPLYAQKKKKSLFIYAEYDTTFLPQLSEDIVKEVARLGIDHQVAVLPCGHYTLGETPFKFMDGYKICSFFKRHL